MFKHQTEFSNVVGRLTRKPMTDTQTEFSNVVGQTNKKTHDRHTDRI